MKALTISRKIALGFTALIVITGVLGGLAVSGMKTVQTSTRILATEFVPEVDMAGNLQGHVASATLAIRSYGFTGDATYLTEAHRQLALVHEDLGIAQKLAAEHPNLVRLREDLGPITSTLKVYEQAVADTESRNNEIAAVRVKLDTAAADFLANVDRLIETQKGQLQADIKAGAEPARLLERITKLTDAQDIRGMGNVVFIGVFKAQALHNNDLFSEALKNFPPLEKKLTELQGLLTVKTDLDQLARVKTDSVAYRDAAQIVMQNSISLAEIGQQRFAAATQLLTIADDIQNTGMKRTIEAADSSDRRLTVSSFTILIGIGSALLIGFGVAFFIIRGTTKVLTSVADSMSDSSSQVTSAATQVAAASQTLAEGASEQAASLEETSASLEEMSSMTKRNAESAQRAKELSGLTRHSADTGATHMQEMRQAMDAIKASSDDIAKIIKTIDEIAFQTNILALNAAVEAARAGEAGMGFAVVAEEVRSLAQRSAQSAKETAGKIEDAIRKSEHGVIISAKVAESLADIVGKARQMDSLVAEIATASAEQNQGIGQLNSAVSQMDKVTQSNASGAEESAAAAEELNAQALAMQQSVADLRRLVTHDAVESTSSESAHAAPDRTATAPMHRPNVSPDRRHAASSIQIENPAQDHESFANT